MSLCRKLMLTSSNYLSTERIAVFMREIKCKTSIGNEGEMSSGGKLMTREERD